MATIKIIDGINGSFPAQSATLIFDLLTVRTSTGELKSYAMTSSIASLKMASQYGDDIEFSLKLTDGSHFKGKAHKSTIEYLAKLAGVEATAPYVIPEQAKQPKERESLLAWFVVISIPAVLLYQCTFKTETTVPTKITAPVVAPVQQLSPEDLAKQQKSLQEYEARQEKGAKAAAAVNAMHSVKNSELLLDGAVLDLKNGKLNDADAYAIGAILEVIYSTAHALQEGWTNREFLTPTDISHLKSVETKLLSFQQRAFPKLRLAYKKRRFKCEVHILMP